MPSLEVRNDGCEESHPELWGEVGAFLMESRARGEEREESRAHVSAGVGAPLEAAHWETNLQQQEAWGCREDPTGPVEEFEVWIRFLSLQTEVGTNVADTFSSSQSSR